MLTRLLCVLAAASCGTALAQSQPDATRPPAPPAARPASPAAQPASQDAAAKRERLLRAAKLPREAQECRRKGVPDDDMKHALRAARGKGLKADEISDITAEQRRAIDDHGPVDNFGAFVQSKLDEGLRGRDLAAAIRAEHAKRGKGKGFKPVKDQKVKQDKTVEPGDDTTRAKGKARDDSTRPQNEKGKGKGGG